MYAINTALSAFPVTPLGPVHRVWEGARAPHKPDLSGLVLGARYRLLGLMGGRGAATVHAAEDLGSGRRLVVRLFQEPYHGGLGRCFAEARAALNLNHVNIADIVDFGHDILRDGETVAYIVTHPLEGESVAITLELDEPWPWTRVLALGKQLCLALVETHEQCIVHCDLGPATRSRVTREAQELFKMLDPGAPGPAAPERLVGEPFDCRTDIYALGLLMYRLATHALPYDLAHGQTEPTPMCQAAPSLSFPAAFEAVVLKALAHGPMRRYTDPKAMHDALVHAESASQRPSRLGDDPLRWNHDAHHGSTWHARVPAAASAELSEPDAGDSRQSSSLAPTLAALLLRVTLAMTLTTVAVRAAWTLLS